MVEVKFEKVPTTLVECVRLTGPYENWGRGLIELKAWVEMKGVKITGPPIGLFYDNPLETPREKLRSEACLPIATTITAEAKFETKDLPGGDVATTTHTGPPEEYTKTYGTFLEWILTNGYTFTDPAREIYGEISDKLGPGMGTIIQQPIKKQSRS